MPSAPPSRSPSRAASGPRTASPRPRRLGVWLAGAGVGAALLVSGWGLMQDDEAADPTQNTAQPAARSPAAAAATATPDTATPPAAPPLEQALAQRPATLPPGLVLVATQPQAQPPQATLLLDGQLQVQTVGASVAGSRLVLQAVTAEAATLGLAQGPALYTLPVSAADVVRGLMAETRTRRLAERSVVPTQQASPDTLVVQQDAGQRAPLPEAMQVTVRRR